MEHPHDNQCVLSGSTMVQPYSRGIACRKKLAVSWPAGAAAPGCSPTFKGAALLSWRSLCYKKAVSLVGG